MRSFLYVLVSNWVLTSLANRVSNVFIPNIAGDCSLKLPSSTCLETSCVASLIFEGPCGEPFLNLVDFKNNALVNGHSVFYPVAFGAYDPNSSCCFV